MKKLLLAAALLAFATTSNAQVLFEIVSGTNTSSTQNVDPAITISATPFVRGSGLTSATGSTFNSQGFDIANTSFADAIADNEFITFSFTSSTAFDLDTFSIRYDRSGSGPNNLDISLDTGSGFVSVFTDAAVADTGEDALDVDLSAFTGVTAGTFRVALFGATSATGTFDFENTTAISTTASSFQLTAIPEPSTYAMLIGAAGLMFFVIRRKRASAL